MSTIVRIAIPKDSSMIAEVLANLDEYPHWKSRIRKTVESKLQRDLESVDASRQIFVGEIDGVVVGYSSVHWLQPLCSEGEGYVTELFIRADSARKGIGRALLERIQAEAKLRNCTRLTLINLRHRKSYLDGVYASLGWQEQLEAARFLLPIQTNSNG